MRSSDVYPDPMFRGAGLASGPVTAAGALDMNSNAISGVTTLALSGAITQAEDTDTNNIFGKVRLDSRVTDEAYFSHYDFDGTSQYALRQRNSGLTILNGVTNTNIAVGGTVIAACTSTAITLSDAINLAFNTTTGTQIGTAAGQKLAFYGTTPIAQQTGVAVTAAGIHAACVSLGLFTA